jgi:hypothetical protein
LRATESVETLADVVDGLERLVDVLDRLGLAVEEHAEVAGFLAEGGGGEVGRGVVDGRVHLLAGLQPGVGLGDDGVEVLQRVDAIAHAGGERDRHRNLLVRWVGPFWAAGHVLSRLASGR